MILNIYKPAGPTSHDIVDIVRKLTGEKRVGHAGTLDPFAEGILIVLVGRNATKRQQEFLKTDKEYRAKICLGGVSDTDDVTGSIKYQVSSIEQKPTKEEVENVLKSFVGEIEQVPPIYSAVKLRGKKAYEIARKGGTPQLKPKKVTIHTIKILNYKWPYLKIKIECSSGTYIRALSRDIGKKLRTGAYVEKLLRTKVGNFLLQDAIPLKDLEQKLKVSVPSSQ